MDNEPLLSVVDTLTLLFGIVLVVVGPYVVLYETDYRGLGIVFVLLGVWMLLQQWIRSSDSRP